MFLEVNEHLYPDGTDSEAASAASKHVSVEDFELLKVRAPELVAGVL